MPSEQTHPVRLRLEFIPLHIDAFQDEGRWYARAREFGVVAHGDSEAKAINHVYNMVMRSVFVAVTNGNLPQVLRKAGITIKVGVPEDDSTQPNLWFVPLNPSATHVSSAGR